MKVAVLIFSAVSTIAAVAPAFSQDVLYSLSVKGSFTTSSRLFYNVDATDEFARSQYIELDDVFGIGLDIRRAIEDTRLQIGLSVEYLRARESGSLRYGSGRVPVEDGYWSVPVELTGYFVIPFSSETFLFYIGGGTGLYLGKRLYSVGSESARILDSRNGVGIHVVTGLEYSVSSWFAVRSELKFRDVQFESTVMDPLKGGSTRARINVDGMLFDAGIVFPF